MTAKRYFGDLLRAACPPAWRGLHRLRHGQWPERPTPEFTRLVARHGAAPVVTPGSFLAALDRQPAHVLDIGVALGSPDLYAAFPGARFVLVDPQKGFERRLRHRPEGATLVNVAVGAEPGRMVLHSVRGHASLHLRLRGEPDPRGRDYEVEVTTLDRLIDALDPAGRIGIKLDVEGHELEALKGLTRHLDRIDFIACEVSVLDRFAGGYRFAEMIARLDAMGFRFYAIMSTPHPEQPLRYYDCLFLPADAPEFR